MKKITNLQELVSVLIKRWSQLDDMNPTYLSEAGQAAKEAYRNVIWYTNFYDTIQDLAEDKEFMNLVSMPNKHPEYYKVLRSVNRVIERVINPEKI